MKEFCFNLCSRVGNSSDHLDQPSCCGYPVSHLHGGNALHISQPPAWIAALSGPDALWHHLIGSIFLLMVDSVQKTTFVLCSFL